MLQTLTSWPGLFGIMICLIHTCQVGQANKKGRHANNLMTIMFMKIVIQHLSWDSLY